VQNDKRYLPTHASCVYLEEQPVWDMGLKDSFLCVDSLQGTNGILQFHWHFSFRKEMQKRGKHLLADLGHIKC
jgi:hypothetical protein